MKININYHFKNLFEIPIDFYKKENIKYLILDLDNTLDSYKDKDPSQKTKDYIKLLKENGVVPFIFSNNNKNRIARYVKNLNIESMYHAFKPFPFKIRKFLKNKNINFNEVAMAGDQIMTDVKCANKLKVRIIFLDPLTDKDGIYTKINRIIERIHIKNLKKNDKMNYWNN